MSFKLCMIAAAVPPKMDGIGDYSANLAGNLTQFCKVKILTSRGYSPTPIPGVEIQQAFDIGTPRSLWNIVDCIKQDQPDWVLLQYNPFSYGRWGLNVHLPLAIQALKKSKPIRFALMVHEPFVSIESWQFAIMTTWQRTQLWMLGKLADTIFVSIQPWTKKFQSWFGSKVSHLPVGSNIPRAAISRAQSRAQLGIDDKTTVIGLFGTMDYSRRVDHVRKALQTIRIPNNNLLILYIGSDGDLVRTQLQNLPVRDEKRLSIEEVSHRFSAMDIYLAPFADGVSTRRTSLMIGLQHGVATVGTIGKLTDAMLAQENGRAFLLANVNHPQHFNDHLQRLVNDLELRRSLGINAMHLYEKQFGWDTIRSSLLAKLR